MKDIPGFEGLYAITTDGRVWSYPKSWVGGRRNNYKIGHGGKWLVLRKGNSDQSYYSVSLSKDGKTKNFYVHALVARAFIPNPFNCPCINHKDGNRLNNDSSNLEWCTQSENLEHAKKTGLSKNYGETHYNRKLTIKKVLEIRSKYQPFVYTVTRLADEYGVSRGAIQHIIENKTWKEVTNHG